VFRSAHFEIKRRRLGEITDSFFDFERRVEDVKARNSRGSRAGRQEARQHSHRGCLAGAVRSQEADDLAPLDFERNVIDSRVTRIPLGKRSFTLIIEFSFLELRVSVLSLP